MIISIFTTLIINPAYADGWFYQTQLTSNVEADNNKRLDSDDEQGSVGAIARVDIKLSNVTEISDVYVRGALRSERYDSSDDDVRNTDDQLLYAGGRWDGERSQLKVDGEFLRQSTQFTELTDSGITDNANRRVDKSISSQYSYAVLEDTQIFAGASYSEVDFPNATPVDLTEYTVEGVNAGVVYYIDELNYLTFSVFNSDYEADTFVSDVESTGGSIRYDKSVNELWKGYAGFGYRKSNFKNESSGSIVRDDDTGSTYEIGVSREDEVSVFSVDVASFLEPSSDGDVNERTEVNFGYQRSFSDRLSSRIDLDWFEDKSVNDSLSNDREYWALSLGLDYRFTTQWYITGQVRHRDSDEDNDTDSSDADSDAVIIGIRYAGHNNRI